MYEPNPMSIFMSHGPFIVLVRTIYNSIADADSFYLGGQPLSLPQEVARRGIVAKARRRGRQMNFKCNKFCFFYY